MMNRSWAHDPEIVRRRQDLARECDDLLGKVWFQLKRKYLAPRFFTDTDAKILNRVADEIWLRRLKIYFLGGSPVYEKANFNPDQPRVPAGNPDGGQWTDDGSITVGGSIDLSAAKIRGHHFVPRSLYQELPLRPETRKVFENAVTGPLKGAPHRWSKEHEVYNKAVKEAFKVYLDKSKIESGELTPEGARSFLNEIRKARDPRIRLFNMRIFRMEFQFYLRRIPGRIE